MDTINYVLVYDERAASFPDWETLALDAVLPIVCLVLWVGGQRGWFRGIPKWGITRRYISVFGFIGFVFSTVVMLGMTAVEYMDHSRLRDALRTGSYVLVEGTVEDFTPGDREGHRDESWSVRSGGKVYRYQYSRSFQVPGFHQSAGLIREGLRVRIADVDGSIARLEIEKPSSRRRGAEGQD